MKNTETVKAAIYKLFNQFRMDEINDEKFISSLKTLCKSRGNKSYWWRFFKGDTGANDAASCESCLSVPKNRQYLNQCIDIAIETGDLTVYLS